MKFIHTLIILFLIFFTVSCKDSKERYYPEEKFIETYTENAKKWIRQSDENMRKFAIKFGIVDDTNYDDLINCIANTYTALTTDLDWMKKVVNEDNSLNLEDVKNKIFSLSRIASKICISEFKKKELCSKKEAISSLSMGGNSSISIPDELGNSIELTAAECGYSAPYKLRVIENGYMCAIVFYSKVDNLVISGLEVNGTFLHNFKGYKTLQRSFVINKEEYKEFQDNTGPCNIKELVIHTNKGIFIERK